MEGCKIMQQTSILSMFTILLFFTLTPILVTSDTLEELPPTVLMTVLVRNQAHTLPYFLECLEKLDYPKDRISLWIRSDHNTDNSSGQLETWLDHVTPLYHSVDFKHDDSQRDFPKQHSALHWSEDRLHHVTMLRQLGLVAGRRMRADYVLMIDADVILKNPRTIQILINQKKTIVAPLMTVTNSNTYANFWAGMNKTGFYTHTITDRRIIKRKTPRCHEVAMVHSVVLINLNRVVSQHLNYYPPPRGYKGDLNDMVIFAQSAKLNGVKMHILNTEFFGYLPLPMEARHSLQDAVEEFVFLKTEAIIDNQALKRIKYLHPTPMVTEIDKLGLDQIYVISLKRRPDRREKMQQCFDELGIDFIFVDAVDGELLNGSYLETLNIRMLPGFQDPNTKRQLRRGEIGCFLSHYFIWLDILEKSYKQVAIFEDDIRFEPYFRRDYRMMMGDVKTLQLEWDLIYLGRTNQLVNKHEEFVNGTNRLVRPNYSYSTMGYLLANGGAKKLLSHHPLQKMIPVDEYIPVLLDAHPNVEWNKAFRPRNMVSLSVDPLLVYQDHYMYEKGYNSDTEDTEVLHFSKDGRILKGFRSESNNVIIYFVMYLMVVYFIWIFRKSLWRPTCDYRVGGRMVYLDT